VSDCSRTEACPFFQSRMVKMPATAEMFRHKYCHNEWAKCARFRVLAVYGSAGVPDDLSPNDEHGADALLREARC
jgi:hypothetical protein